MSAGLVEIVVAYIIKSSIRLTVTAHFTVRIVNWWPIPWPLTFVQYVISLFTDVSAMKAAMAVWVTILRFMGDLPEPNFTSGVGDIKVWVPHF